MSVIQELMERSGNKCELSGSEENLSVYEITPSDGSAEQSVLLGEHLRTQIENPETMNPNDFRCLNDSMWSPVPAVQVLSYRLLHSLKAEGWPMDLLDMMYLDDDLRAWAEANMPTEDDDREPTKDINGTLLQEGDDVTIAKDLDVKGAGFTAKRGTMVKNIHLTDNPRHIEGKVNGIQVVLVAAYMKKSS